MGEARERKLAKAAGKPWERDLVRGRGERVDGSVATASPRGELPTDAVLDYVRDAVRETSRKVLMVGVEPRRRIRLSGGAEPTIVPVRRPPGEGR